MEIDLDKDHIINNTFRRISIGCANNLQTGQHVTIVNIIFAGDGRINYSSWQFCGNAILLFWKIPLMRDLEPSKNPRGVSLYLVPTRKQLEQPAYQTNCISKIKNCCA